MRLLLIDDDEVDRMAVVRTLQTSNLASDIVQASTAIIGLRYFEEDAFDAVLLDYCLPDMECLEVLRCLTSHVSKHAAVIILTGVVDDETLERQCIEAGAQDFLLKKDVSHRLLTKALLHAQTRHTLKQQLLDTHNRLKSLAENDPLTGLANRYFFDQHLRAAIRRSERADEKLGLLFLDLDNFKLINDSLGHDAGDHLLQLVAQRLLSVVRGGDIVCRLGGDEFAIIVHHLESHISVITLSQRIMEVLHMPISLPNGEYGMACSIGIATFPDCANTAEEMCKHADLAMYHVKNNGRNGFYFYSEVLQAQVLHRITLEADLRSKRLQNQLMLYYQPVLNAQTFAVCGAEMLIRWDHPSRGVLAPNEFMSVAEELGLMASIDKKNRRIACRQLAAWRASGVVDDRFVLAINVCAQTLLEDNLDIAVKADIDDAGLTGDTFSMEVTEGTLVANFEQASMLLNRMKEFGVAIALDDFGTGYSSMAYLKRLPASILKVDRTFVQNVPESAADVRVLKAMISMAKSLGLAVIVEGVETMGQALLCREYGADMLQGFLFSKPLLPGDFAVFCENAKCKAIATSIGP